MLDNFYFDAYFKQTNLLQKETHMKKITFIITLFFVLFSNVYGQVSNYTFVQSNGTYASISGGSLLGTATNNEEFFTDSTNLAGNSSVTTGIGFPIGFNFTFNGSTFDRVGIHTNGWISLGQSTLSPAVNMGSTGATAYEPLSSSTVVTPAQLRNRIAGVGGDLQGQTGASLRIQTIGTAPNRVLVVQWTNYKRFSGSGIGDILNFQIRLNETSNLVNIVYDRLSYTNNSSNAYEVGIGGQTNADYNNRATANVNGDWNASFPGVVNTSVCYINSGAVTPVSGLTFTWGLSAPCSGSPTSGTVAPSSITVCTGASPGTLTASGISAFITGLTYQWEQSNDNFATAVINAVGGTGATTKIYSPPAFSGTTIYYRLKVTCSNSSQSSYSNTVTISPNTTTIIPTFTAVSPICSGATLSALPTTSNNGISGTWSPAINNTNTTTYTFTPATGQCATTATMTITVNPNVTPTFTAVAPICSGDSLSALPTTSNNGITGTWSPALNNTATTTYTFTPTAGLCATTATMTITVNTSVPPTVTSPVSYVLGNTATPLTASGSNLLWYTTATGGTGSSTAPTPSTATLGTTSYWVTQNPGSCGESTRAQIDVVVSPAASNLNFDGVNDRVIIPDATNLQINNNFTIEFWFKTQSVSQTQKYIFSKGGSSNQYAIIYEYVDNQMEFYSFGGSTGADPRNVSQIAINDTNWHHIAYTYNGTSFTGYRDGNLVFTATGLVFNLNPLSGSNLFLGSSPIGGANPGMNMDEFRMWNRALSQAEIQNNLNCELPGGQTGLLVYYKFNQGAANGNNTTLNTVTDLSSNNNNGTLNGFALSGATSNWVDNSIITSGNICTPFLNVNDFDSEEFKIFPNPVKNILYLKYNHQIDEIVVYNMLGQTLLSKPIKNMESSVDISSLPKGSYFVKIIVDGKTKTVKIVKE